jgi:hypothetical protein
MTGFSTDSLISFDSHSVSHSEQQLLRAISTLQAQTGRARVPKSAVAQYMRHLGSQEKFQSVCARAVSNGLVVVGPDGPHGWVALPTKECSVYIDIRSNEEYSA